jgi:hypothetical protein
MDASKAVCEFWLSVTAAPVGREDELLRQVEPSKERSGPSLRAPDEDGPAITLWAAPYKMHDQGDDCDDQEKVNQAPRDVEHKRTKDPCDQKDNE